MTKKTLEVFVEALSQPQSVRAALAHRILESLDRDAEKKAKTKKVKLLRKR